MLQESLELNNKKIILTRKNRFNTGLNNSDLYNLPDLNFNSNQNSEENMDSVHLLDLQDINETDYIWTYNTMDNDLLLKILQKFNDYKLLISEFNIKINVQLTSIEKKSIINSFYNINLKSYLEKVWWKTIILWSNIVPAVRNSSSDC